MNTAYDFSEAATLVAKLLAPTRDGKIEWTKTEPRLYTRNKVTDFRYQAMLDEGLGVTVWSTEESAGFRLYDQASAEIASVLGNQVFSKSERDLVSVSIDHKVGETRRELYTNLISLIELARRSEDKIQPKVNRAKEYLDRLTA